MDAAVEHICEECGGDVSYYFAPDEEHIDAICAICALQETCSGQCGISEEMAHSLDPRAVARLLQVFDMLAHIFDAVEVASEMDVIGSMPSTGLDVDLSEHHLSSEVLGRLEVSAAEFGGTARALVRTLIPVFQDFPRESAYVIGHHPVGPVVQEIVAREM